MRKSFFNRQSTAICAMLVEESIEAFIAGARNAHARDADAIYMDLGKLPPEQRTEENLRRVFQAVQLPFYISAYRGDLFLQGDDEARQTGLIAAAKAGAELIDVMGDLYAPSPCELTDSPAAIQRQLELISRIHDLGAKVVMSSHMFEQTKNAEQILKHLQEQARRGADMLKIVTPCNSQEDFQEAIRTFFLLNQTLDRPYVYLAGGTFGRLHRFLGMELGSAIEFAVCDYQPGSGLNQPTISAFKQVRAGINWRLEDLT